MNYKSVLYRFRLEVSKYFNKKVSHLVGCDKVVGISHLTCSPYLMTTKRNFFTGRILASDSELKLTHGCTAICHHFWCTDGKVMCITWQGVRGITGSKVMPTVSRTTISQYALIQNFALCATV